MQIVADLHLHSKYSRAVSQYMTPPVMAQVGKEKGINLLATGDWTHPMWFKEIRNYLTEAEEGLYKIKDSTDANHDTRFLLSVEISNIYSQGGKGRRIHNLVFSPSFETSEKINKELIKRGYNVSSDGRPIIGLSSKNLLQLILEIDERCLLIPCHVWTPWFGLYGMSSGFQSLQECFEELSPYVYGIETGLSSDPEMNWQIKELDTRSILSFSDAHSPAKMGREATVFELDSLSYENIRQAIMRPSVSSPTHNNKVLYTIEFYPEEGKYHYSGHRNCKVTMTPDEQRATQGICPVCNRHVTDGVMRRVQELADEDPRANIKVNEKKLKWYLDPKGKHPPFVKIVPLLEIVAESLEMRVGSVKVKNLFDTVIKEVGSELDILLKIPLEQIAKVGGEKLAAGVQKVREGNIIIQPGYDGVYGVVKIWHETKEESSTENSETEEENKTQLGLEF
jgi:uncharacterized protein (TIGR00375 family)